MAVQIIRGHVIDSLRALPSDHFHCCISSPPYWGLRLYGIESTIWGGDPNCAHQWGPQGKKGGGSHAHTESSQQNGVGTKAAHEQISQASTGAFCSCGAWKGDLGLEPYHDCGLGGMVRLRRDLTDAQREYVARRLLGVADRDGAHGDTERKASTHSQSNIEDQDTDPKA